MHLSVVGLTRINWFKYYAYVCTHDMVHTHEACS